MERCEDVWIEDFKIDFESTSKNCLNRLRNCQDPRCKIYFYERNKRQVTGLIKNQSDHLPLILISRRYKGSFPVGFYVSVLRWAHPNFRHIYYHTILNLSNKYVTHDRIQPVDSLPWNLISFRMPLYIEVRFDGSRN